METEHGAAIEAPPDERGGNSYAHLHHRATSRLYSANERATTYLRVSDPNRISLGALKTTEWQVYRGPFLVTLTAAQTLTVEYYSIDSAGNQESIKTRVLQ